MIVSQYTHLCKGNDAFMVYNSLSNSLLTVDDEMFAQLEKAKSDGSEVDESLFDSEELNVLKRKGIITENRYDELLTYKAAVMPIRSLSGNLNLTIATTLDCNYSCFYCFENKQVGANITEEVLDNLLAYIDKRSDLKHLHVTWFGGEPLMQFEKMRYFTSKLHLPDDVMYSSSIITNGYYLNEEVIRSLKEMRIKAIQLTLDGMKVTHNKRKRSKDTDDTFDAVLRNIDKFTELEKEVQLNIRVNLDEINKHEFLELAAFLKQRYPEAKNVQIFPAFIAGTSKEDCRTCDMDRDALATFTQEIALQTGSTEHIYPRNIMSECTARNPNILVIAPDGGLSKCLETVGEKKYEFGKLTEKGLEVTDHSILNRYMYGADPMEDSECTSCDCLPICFGGCPHKRLQNKLEGASFDLCISHKNNMDSYLKQYMAIVEK